MTQTLASEVDASARGFDAVTRVELSTDVCERELALPVGLGSQRRGLRRRHPGGARRGGRGGPALWPCANERVPVGCQLTRGEKTSTVSVLVSILTKDEVRKLTESAGRILVIFQLLLAVLSVVEKVF